jgi:hypothetical protein
MKWFSGNSILLFIMLTIIIFPLSIYAISESSGVTLEFPAGAENTGLAESGVSLSNSINTMFWNPAALPAVYDNLQTRIQAGYFTEHPLNSEQLNHTYTTGALFLNDLLPNIDIAYGFYKNVFTSWFHEERVFSNCIGIRALKIFSIGISFKSFKQDNAATSIKDLVFNPKPTFAFDLGTRVEYTARIASTPLTLEPELGLSLVNLGRDSAIGGYVYGKGPLPRGFFIGGSVTTKLLEFCSYTMAAQARASLLKLKSQPTDTSWSNYQYDGGHDLLVSLSNKCQITPFYSYGFGYMVDYNNRRFEFHDVHTFILDARKVMAIIYRVMNRDFEPESQNLLKFQEMLSLYKGKIKPNLRFSYSTADINSIDGNARDGQKGIDFSLGF